MTRMTRILTGAVLAVAAFSVVTLGLGAGAVLAKPAKPAKAGAPPTGSAAEMDKLKGDFKWGMTPDEVTAKIQERVRATYEDRLKKTVNDPTRHDRLRKEMLAEAEKVKTKQIKFDGQKSGYDVSIIDQEFLHDAGESMLVAKEETSTRYFFFKDDRLYKMFIAFDKEILQGKSFKDFGQLMQARFGKAREVTVEEKNKAGARVKLDHYVWASKGGDMLRLVDRSEFYDVYCLVIYDGNIARQQEAARLARRSGPARDNLVEAVTTQPANTLDPHDNVVDQITGKATPKLGEQRGETITVPSPTAPPPLQQAAPDKGNEKARGGKETGKGKPENDGLKL